MKKSNVNKNTNIQGKEEKAMKKSVICNEKAYETVSKKGTPIIVLIDTDGKYHYIELKRMTKYNVYTGEPYESNEHKAYTFIEAKETDSDAI
jgi:hypothetical protein